MLGRLLPELYALPTPAIPSAASSRMVRMNPVMRLTRLATAIDPLLASRPRVVASTGATGPAGAAGGAASTGGAVPVAGSGTTAASSAAPAGAASVGGAVSSGAGASMTAVPGA